MDLIQSKIVAGNVCELEQLLQQISQTESAPPAVLLSHAYAKLTHHNVPLSAEVVHFIESELIKASYQRAAAYQPNDSTAKSDSANRVVHLVNSIDLIVNQHRTGLYTDIDESMIQRLRHVYAHVFFLKTHHRKLPLLQLQFCIAVFLKLVTGKANNDFDVFSFAIDKERLIRFLQLVRNELVSSQHSRTISFESYYQYIGYLLNPAGRSKASLRVPKRIRTFIRADFRVMQPLFSGNDCKMSFTELPPQLQKGLKAHYDKTVEWDARRQTKKYFKELNDTYFLMKQHYSIRKILSYIDGIPEATPNSPPSPTTIRAIKRIIQVIGETIKSTRETPNITVKLNRVLKLITSVALTERTKDLRQFFSHGYPLSKWELERATPADVATVFQTIGKNLREARHWFVYTQTQQNLRLYRRYLAYLLAFDSMDALRSYIAFLGTEFKASLIQSFLPEQLTEAKLLLQEMLRTSSSRDSDPAYTATLRPDLEYLEREIELRINAIRTENASLGRTVDEYFFLETYIRQPSGSLDRVRTIVRSVLCATELSNRHKLVEKTDLQYGRELMARLHTMERDGARANLWHSIWQRLARDNFEGIDTLLGRTEQRSDVALDETVRTMQCLGLPLADEAFVEFVNRRFVKSYYHNVFVLDNKYRVLKEIIKDRRAQVGVRDALAKLKELRRSDEAVLQGMYDQLLDRMGETLNNASGARADHIALEYSLLEVSEILCNLGLFRDNVADLAASMTPVVTGRNLRNYLAHDSLAYDTLMAGCPVPGATIVRNAQFLIKHRTRLYHAPSVSGPHSVKGEQLHFEEVFKLQTEWTAQQVEFLERVKQMDLVQQIACGTRADLLLRRRDHLDYDIVSIALNANPAKFISQLVCYEQSEANFFHILLSHDCMGDVNGMIRSLIENPHQFCLRLALMSGLWEETEASFRRCRDEPEVQSIVTREVPLLFLRHSTPFIVSVLELFPLAWFHGVANHLGNTILHLAVLRGDKDLLLLVLRRYGNLVNVANKFGDLPLLIAVLYSNDTAIADLLKHGADPCVAPNILAKVAFCNRLPLLQRVSDAFATRMPPAGDDLRNNPMRAALESGQFKVFRTLHRTFRYDLRQGELLHLAARLNRLEFLRYILLEVADIDPVNAGHCFTPLMVACGSGHYESAQLLLQHGASGVFRNENGYSPWHCAVFSGRKRVVRLLLAMCPGVDVNAITRDKHSALGLAIEAGHSVRQMMVLLKAGVSVSADHVLQACTGDRFALFKLLFERHPEFLEARDYFQRSPLMLAVIEGSVPLVRYLLACGANVNTVNMLGMGCLHVAAMNNQVQICTILLETRIDCEATDHCCRTPLVVALECEHLTVVEMMLRHGVQLESAYRFRYGVRHRNASLLHKFTIEKRPRMVQYLLQNLRFPPDTKDDDGKTAAMYETSEE